MTSPHSRRRSERRRNRDNFDNRVFLFEDVLDVVALIANDELPNAEYGDDECCLYAAIIRTLNTGEV